MSSKNMNNNLEGSLTGHDSFFFILSKYSKCRFFLLDYITLLFFFCYFISIYLPYYRSAISSYRIVYTKIDIAGKLGICKYDYIFSTSHLAKFR